MNKQLDEQVRTRARNFCEYCRVPQSAFKPTFPIDHIIARQHGGPTVLGNLALCCGRCNQHKGPNLSGLDPLSRKLTRLFHPRDDKWVDHFRYEGAVLAGRSDVGRTTVVVLDINHPYSLAVRLALLEGGSWRPLA